MSESFELHSQRAARLIAMGQMAASMAHEIRNPLGSMELFCTLLKKDLSSQPDLYQLAEQMHESIKVLDRIIANCLEFTRDRSAKLKTIPSVEDYFAQILRDAGPKADAKGITIETELVGELAPQADPYLLKQALLNLVFNAIDAAAEGGKHVKLFSNTSDSAAWVIKITDNGSGIPDEVRERIFEPFYTTKDEGTGLGLAIVHSLISAHDGTLSLSSEPGEGTEITISIPQPSGANGGQS
ncbi:MAG: HAMP domain-containing histidine kinase [Bdellovibrionales bacterium]|nr:HAMP domain-containing histidine kinase [Bdellovibrionales bacterium]